MKLLYIAPILALFLSCTEKPTTSDKQEDIVSVGKIVVPEFQAILDAANVEGAILFYDFDRDKYYSNDFEWSEKGNLPASTFKIPNSIIALETGTVESDSALFKWNGEKRRLKNWEQDLTLRDAFHYSCVPCYQEVARKIGVKKMAEHLNKLDYGNMKFDSTNIDLFWLAGESRISQFQQIDFLKRFYQSKLPISERTESIMKQMMVIEEKDGNKLSGKTGWSISEGNSNAWFVGVIETQNNTYFFATNVEPTRQCDMNAFPMIRKDVTHKAFEQLPNKN